jgi:G-patch domain
MVCNSHEYDFEFSVDFFILDSSKFGAKYLQSLGWTSGTGLGVSGEGRTSNLKVRTKSI